MVGVKPNRYIWKNNKDINSFVKLVKNLYIFINFLERLLLMNKIYFMLNYLKLKILVKILASL